MITAFAFCVVGFALGLIGGLVFVHFGDCFGRAALLQQAALRANLGAWGSF